MVTDERSRKSKAKADDGKIKAIETELAAQANSFVQGIKEKAAKKICDVASEIERDLAVNLKVALKDYTEKLAVKVENPEVVQLGNELRTAVTLGNLELCQSLAVWFHNFVESLAKFGALDKSS